MPATINVRYLTVGTKMSKINFGYLTYHKVSATINECQVLYLEMLGTYPIAGMCEIVRY